MALLVSGGHSSLLLAPDITADVRPLGSTIDDAAGEAFDKVARVLNLGFPGGPVIDRYATEGDPAAIAFPRGLTGPRDAPYDFSFSGLKTAVARWIEAKRNAGEEVPVRGRVRLLPGGRHRRADPQGDPRLQGRGRRPPDDRRRRRRQLPAARHGRGALRGRGHHACGCPGPSCAPTTARWSPRSAPRWSPATVRSPTGICRPTPRLPVTEPHVPARKRRGGPGDGHDHPHAHAHGTRTTTTMCTS